MRGKTLFCGVLRQPCTFGWKVVYSLGCIYPCSRMSLSFAKFPCFGEVRAASEVAVKVSGRTHSNVCSRYCSILHMYTHADVCTYSEI